MNYDAQRGMALRMVQRYGSRGVIERVRQIPDPEEPWKSTVSNEVIPVYFVAFADDGVTFVNHNIEGDVKMMTVVSNTAFDMHVGDKIRTGTKIFNVRVAKALDPDLSGAILWAALVQ